MQSSKYGNLLVKCTQRAKGGGEGERGGIRGEFFIRGQSHVCL